jgi:hypothetical protein
MGVSGMLLHGSLCVGLRHGAGMVLFGVPGVCCVVSWVLWLWWWEGAEVEKANSDSNNNATTMIQTGYVWGAMMLVGREE